MKKGIIHCHGLPQYDVEEGELKNDLHSVVIRNPQRGTERSLYDRRAPGLFPLIFSNIHPLPLEVRQNERTPWPFCAQI